jgi:hypothetical protein
MSAVKGRVRRPHVGGLKRMLLQARVDEQSWTKANKAADAAGISMSAYIQSLIDRDEVDADGCPVWRGPQDPGQEELPLRTA